MGGTMSKVTNTFGSGESVTPFIVPVLGAITGIVIVVMIIYAIIQLSSTSMNPKTVVLGPIDVFSPTTDILIDRKTVSANMAGSYTLSYYIRIDAVPDMRAEATPLISWPGVWSMNYNPSHEELVWIINDSHVSLKSVPLQRWTQVTISFEGRTIDLYINGNLVKSHILTHLPPLGNSSISIIPGGIMGQLAYVQMWPRRLTVSDVEQNNRSTSNSRGYPNLGPEFLSALKNIKLPNIFCPAGGCSTMDPVAGPTQRWEFPYA
jgi:hypothetical protein